MRKIYTYSGEEILVDEEDYDRVKPFTWSLNDRGYAVNKNLGKMHRYIMGVSDPKIQCDHRGNNKLDNRKSELRVCNNSENQMNKGKYKNNTSGFKGVTILGNRFKAKIRAFNKQYNLGVFNTAEEAAEAYDRAAIKYHGDFFKPSRSVESERT